jgi:hypothetical protein
MLIDFDTRKEILISSGTKSTDIYLCIMAIIKYLRTHTENKYQSQQTYYDVKRKKKIRILERVKRIRITISDLPKRRGRSKKLCD